MPAKRIYPYNFPIRGLRHNKGLLVMNLGLMERTHSVTEAYNGLDSCFNSCLYQYIKVARIIT